MKKLIMAVVAIAFAAVAQAATVDWKTSATGKIYEAGTTTLLAAADAYLINLADHSQGDILAAFVSNGDIASMAVTTKKSVASGVISAGTFEWAKEGSVDCYLAVIAGDNIFISDTVNQELSEVGAPLYQFKEKTLSQAAAIGSASDGYTSAGWYTAVPEPTSALMLLIGMAGLALRRKQA